MAGTAAEFFRDLAERTAGGSARAKGLTATYRFDIEGAGSWRVAVDDGAISVSESGSDDDAADCAIAVSERTFLGIVSGEQSPTGAFLMGKIRVEGDTALALRLRDLLG